jgi:tRNA G18 (ribose-2'-O)-methylase SpoU
MESYETITDRGDPGVQRIVDVAKPSRTVLRTILVEDEEPVLQSLRGGVDFIEVYALETAPVPAEVAEICREKDVPIRLLGTSLATEVFKSEKRPKLFGIARAPRALRPGGVYGRAGDVVVLDGVSIVGNIGAVVRSAYAFGAAGVLLVDSGLASIADRRLIRASRGYVFSLPVALATREQARNLLAEGERRVVALDGGGRRRVREISEDAGDLALVFGAEKTGLSEEVASAVDWTAAIPMAPGAESLNVSVAAGVALYDRSERALARAGEAPSAPAGPASA